LHKINQANNLEGRKMKNRLLFCLLFCGFLLYYAVPNLSIRGGGLEGTFAISWLLLALIVIGGNLVGLLYTPKKQRARNYKQISSSQKQQKMRQLG
jgi:hypothetical protein